MDGEMKRLVSDIKSSIRILKVQIKTLEVFKKV